MSGVGHITRLRRAESAAAYVYSDKCSKTVGKTIEGTFR